MLAAPRVVVVVPHEHSAQPLDGTKEPSGPGAAGRYLQRGPAAAARVLVQSGELLPDKSPIKRARRGHVSRHRGMRDSLCLPVARDLRLPAHVLRGDVPGACRARIIAAYRGRDVHEEQRGRLARLEPRKLAQALRDAPCLVG